MRVIATVTVRIRVTVRVRVNVMFKIRGSVGARFRVESYG